jgi:D-glycero-alpha-D-manno-heptose 1-phosphate guanylyltransferase
MSKRLEDATTAILAGGLGTRLRSRLADRPKVLAPVHGRPYLTYLLEQVADAGIRHTVLLTGYRAEQIHAAFGDHYVGLRLTYSVEPSPLGTAGALQRALPHLSSSTILLLNGDSYCAVSLSDLWEAHHDRSADLSIVLTLREDCSRYGRIALGSDDRVLCFEEKSAAEGEGWANAGIYLLSRRLIQEIPMKVPTSLERELCPAWVARKRCFGFRCSSSFLDIGTPESYAQAETFFAPV